MSIQALASEFAEKICIHISRKNSELHLHDCEKLSLEVRKHALFASYFLLASK